MALVKCSECGQMVSDKAEVCPNCGCPIEPTLMCTECGTELKSTDMTCPKCGCPAKKEGNASTATTTVATHAEGMSTTEASEQRKKQVQRFLVENKKKLPPRRMEDIRRTLLALSDSQWESIEYIDFKDPTMMLVISFLVGEFGVDRFMLGDTQNGLFKLLLTCCCGVGLIWWLIDLFKLNEMVLDYNYKMLKETIELV